MLGLLDLIPIRKEELSNYKLHLAIGARDRREPLYELSRSTFKSWQERQSRKNFERDYILALIYCNPGEWLFGGIYKTKGVSRVGDWYIYDTELPDTGNELIGRLVVSFDRPGRQSYLDLEKWADALSVVELARRTHTVVPWPGYENVCIGFRLLTAVVKQGDSQWRSALSSVKGVYVITDRTNGKAYVGAAYGEDSFWSRWSAYAENGHGGNTELAELIERQGLEYASNFQLSILEIRSRITSNEEIQEREAHWKNVLMSREFGYNRN